MGRDQDSVFVDSERTARDAITYLKDQRVPPMTFVPLASCKVGACGWDRARPLAPRGPGNALCS